MVIDQLDTIDSTKKASTVNCGIICHETHARDKLGYEILEKSMEFYRDLGKDAEFDECGAMEICMTKEEFVWAKE